ncbi:MAG: 1,6-anhydro-N-acetylmuramyl-L-alanine amidase AmpD [Tepidimonas sp.]|uniref:1,6-anhydro-N-acetylmuramyl-L-alanine amidase AmpD n=1 Tax=Tepidimonas sp. TaxID=2002775 RepID=UPI00298F0E57|nr:1,6-anhydro-N-acetylmuramyl-L-alanine amidase AmpD [Tepidimonas sp.]MCS6810951.1 1,6-anhydro-N-acetylmuramyl-L-alanine amidase AmpD [Tepidimonas sp.]MDW8336523.1 1,6-anhydro-N-acetylmuramyl-L-alanine amidase AmpD [Tepidimonas sp.]
MHPVPCSLPEGTWLPGARLVPSPNHGPRPAGVAPWLVVLHSISLPPGDYGGPWIEQLFTNTLDCDAHPYFQGLRGLEVSSHFLIRRDGQWVQFVALERRAWHAGRSCWQGHANCNDFSVGIELEGLEGELFSEEQYAALAGLLAALREHLPALRAVAGHEHVAPQRKRDPGPGFDWARLIQLTGWPASWFASTASPRPDPALAQAARSSAGQPAAIDPVQRD